MGQPPDVLLIEDDEDVREAMLGVLSSRKLGVVAVASGREALRHLAESRPRLILLDMTLPDMHGSELLAVIRGQSTFADVPIFGVTGSRPEEGGLPLQGIDGYLHKPFGVDDLMKVVERFCAAE